MISRARSPERIRGAGVAVVPEGRRLLPALTIEDNLRVATYALSREQKKEGIAYALELFPELERRWHTPGRLLSGGEQQMLVLAQALVSHPGFILIDELSLGLAPVVVKRLVPTIESVAASGVGVLLIEQFAHLALSLAKTAYVLEGGRIRYEGTAQELEEPPRRPPLRLLHGWRGAQRRRDQRQLTWRCGPSTRVVPRQSRRCVSCSSRARDASARSSTSTRC